MFVAAASGPPSLPCGLRKLSATSCQYSMCWWYEPPPGECKDLLVGSCRESLWATHVIKIREGESVRPPCGYFWLRFDLQTLMREAGLSNRETSTKPAQVTHTCSDKPGHLLVSFLCYSEDMWVHVAHVLTAVGVDDICSIDGQRLVRVNGHKHDSYDARRKKMEEWAEQQQDHIKRNYAVMMIND